MGMHAVQGVVHRNQMRCLVSRINSHCLVEPAKVISEPDDDIGEPEDDVGEPDDWRERLEDREYWRNWSESNE